MKLAATARSTSGVSIIEPRLRLAKLVLELTRSISGDLAGPTVMGTNKDEDMRLDMDQFDDTIRKGLTQVIDLDDEDKDSVVEELKNVSTSIINSVLESKLKQREEAQRHSMRKKQTAWKEEISSIQQQVKEYSFAGARKSDAKDPLQSEYKFHNDTFENQLSANTEL